MSSVNEIPDSAEAVQLPLLAAPNNPRVILIENPEELSLAVKTLESESGPFGLDAERASGFKYSSRAYLVQVARGSSPIYLIDPISVSQESGTKAFAELASVLKSDTWILHAATQDLGCLAELGLEPTSIFDTELGGRLAGLSRVGLGAMTESLLGFRLAKEHSAVDWSVRPMHQDWLNYAALDVDVLPALMKAVTEALDLQNKSEIARQEFENLLKFKPKEQKPDKWRGTTGLHEVKDSKKLAIARELWLAREQLAQKLDVSPGRLIPDLSISAVAKDTPRSRSELASRKDFNGRASRTYLDTWWHAIEAGNNSRDLPPVRLPATGIPNHRSWPVRFPEAEARLSAAKPTINQIAQALNLPVENLLTPDYLRQLCWQPPQPVSPESIGAFLKSLGARDWQVEAVASTLVAAMAAEPKTTEPNLS
ncbi:MAG: HRDC domain-containing protein [Micrococcales bacterium]